MNSSLVENAIIRQPSDESPAQNAARAAIAVLFIGSLLVAAAADAPARTFKLTAESPQLLEAV